MELTRSKSIRKWIVALSVVIPLAVALLFGIRIEGVDLSFLPPIYATINGLTAVLLLAALVAIKNRKIELHKRLIQTSLGLSLLFLLAYVAYHITSETTVYLGDYKLMYYIILISHILLSVAVIPLVLFTYLFAWEGNYEKHKKWTKISWPIWFYVAVSGVVVYLMISPFYS